MKSLKLLLPMLPLMLGPTVSCDKNKPIDENYTTKHDSTELIKEGDLCHAKTITEVLDEICPRIEGPKYLSVGEIGTYTLIDNDCERPFIGEDEVSADVWLLYTRNFLAPEDPDNNGYTIQLSFPEPGSYDLTYKGDFTTITIEVEE